MDEIIQHNFSKSIQAPQWNVCKGYSVRHHHGDPFHELIAGKNKCQDHHHRDHFHRLTVGKNKCQDKGDLFVTNMSSGKLFLTL